MTAAIGGRPDVIVVGAGASGCALAGRLVDAGARVLLLEAGPVPLSVSAFPADLLSAGSLRGADPAHPAAWAYPATLAPGRDHLVVRGRIAGGSTATNGAYFVRACRTDFDRWAAVAPEWGFGECLPFLRRMETDLDFGSSELHGAAGPMPVSRPLPEHPVSVAFQLAARSAGWARIEDKNVDDGPGIGPVPMNHRNGLRWNTALAYLGPKQDSPLLVVRGGAVVSRALIKAERVRGVLVRTQGSEIVLEADEVVLCAGAIASPQLLLLSGIGPAAHLESVGVDVVHDSPGVGSAFSDHPQVAVSWLPRTPMGADDLTVLQTVLHTRTAEVLPLLKPLPYLLHGRDTAGPLEVLVSLAQPESRGQLRLRSADATARPAIDYSYLVAAGDRQRMRDAVRETAALLTDPAFESISAGLASLGRADLDTDHALDTWIGEHLGTSLHTCGSAPFGPEHDPRAVVNAAGQVYGVAGLRVADTSILADVPSRGPAATAVLIGERVAALMLDDRRRSL